MPRRRRRRRRRKKRKIKFTTDVDEMSHGSQAVRSVARSETSAHDTYIRTRTHYF
jgi:hypothetical protein